MFMMMIMMMMTLFSSLFCNIRDFKNNSIIVYLIAIIPNRRTPVYRNIIPESVDPVAQSV